jgi:hypothetical protein
MIFNSLLFPSFITFFYYLLLLPSFITFFFTSFNYIKLENELQLLYYLIWIICKFLIPFSN